jgi:polyhydroxyalkanoate synthesis repressor PhaR
MNSSVHLIKKYANRKLYHTNQKCYITLEGIARLVQSGEHLQVLDNETGEDITASIMGQVILQTRSWSGNPLPAMVLMSLINLGNDALARIREVFRALPGGQQLVDMEISERIDRLIAEQHISSEEGARLRSLLLEHDAASSPDDAADERFALPNRNDIIRLQQQIDALAMAVEQLSRQKTSV